MALAVLTQTVRLRNLGPDADLGAAEALILRPSKLRSDLGSHPYYGVWTYGNLVTPYHSRPAECPAFAWARFDVGEKGPDLEYERSADRTHLVSVTIRPVEILTTIIIDESVASPMQRLPRRDSQAQSCNMLSERCQVYIRRRTRHMLCARVGELEAVGDLGGGVCRVVIDFLCYERSHTPVGKGQQGRATTEMINMWLFCHDRSCRIWQGANIIYCGRSTVSHAERDIHILCE